MKPLLVTQISALRKSVDKWKNIVAGLEDPDCFVVTERGPEDCACCQEFLHRGAKGCAGCPVAEKVGDIFCGKTPYEEWAEIFDNLDSFTGPKPSARFRTKGEILQRHKTQ